MDTIPSQCASGKQVLWYYPHERLDAKTYVGFSRELFNDLTVQLAGIGYCLRYYSPGDSLASSPGGQDNLCIQIHLNDSMANRPFDFGNGEKTLVVELCKMSELTKPKMNRLVLSLVYDSDDPVSLRSVFVKKIVENLRTQYICTVTITSEPAGVRVRTSNQLTDLTPLEWVVPVGSLHVQCSKIKYLTLDKDLSLPKPGSYSYFLQMKKKQFYNSKYFYPALSLFITSAVFYYFDGYYYDRYNRLGEFELRNSPDSFRSSFQNARNFETASLASFAAGCCLLGLTFWF
jgi:hypothetical protein